MANPMAAEYRHLAVQADETEVRTASAWLEQVCAEHAVPADQLYRLDLCLNEALANIITHGGPAARESAVRLALSIGADDEGNRAELRISDAGQAFNPLLALARDPATSLSDALPGGLGLTMMSGYSDRLDYEFREGRNQQAFLFRWRSPEQ